MKALSIKQPYASLIAHRIKDIENRTWRTHFRGRIYIHASAKRAFNGTFMLNLSEKQCESINLPALYSEPYSAIIGEVDIVDCVINHESIWAEKTEFCPITGKPFFMEIENEFGVNVRTYGGPFDSFTIPVIDDDGYYIRERFCHDRGYWIGSENFDERGIDKSKKPTYNWVLSNAVLYDEPILNVKGKLSFWDFEPE